jgi:sulfite exporter TauE/SafE
MLLAFLTGLFSSLHCVGMCGPIALALPKGFEGRLAMASSRLLYNVGRTLTYILLGLVIGIFGEGIAISGYQQGISIALGVALLLFGLFSLKRENRFLAIPRVDRLMRKLRQRLGRLLGQSTYGSTLSIGLLNGLLPCGFVYLALAGASLAGNLLDSMAYLAFFGLGTMPMMFGVSMLGGVLPASVRQRLRPFLMAFVFIFATLLILRGLDLGIPYLSPELPETGLEGAECG